jgi:transcriptional regulator with XRE-family HTH domain
LSTLFWDVFKNYFEKLLQSWESCVIIPFKEVFTVEIKIKRISDAILNSGYSYAELSKLTGISKSSLQRYATGETKKISLDCVEAIAAATGRDARYLMGWEDETKKSAPTEPGRSKEKEIEKMLRDLSDSELDKVAEFIAFLLSQRKGEK